MNTPSQTPRTDVAEFQVKGRGNPVPDYVVHSSLARQLETELKQFDFRMTKALLDCHAREHQLREALESAGHGENCRWLNHALEECSCHMRALTLPPSPVIPLAVAEKLAEALRAYVENDSYSHAPEHLWRKQALTVFEGARAKLTTEQRIQALAAETQLTGKMLNLSSLDT